MTKLAKTGSKVADSHARQFENWRGEKELSKELFASYLVHAREKYSRKTFNCLKSSLRRALRATGLDPDAYIEIAVPVSKKKIAKAAATSRKVYRNIKIMNTDPSGRFSLKYKDKLAARYYVSNNGDLMAAGSTPVEALINSKVPEEYWPEEYRAENKE